jgi:hypothetical protein
MLDSEAGLAPGPSGTKSAPASPAQDEYQSGAAAGSPTSLFSGRAASEPPDLQQAREERLATTSRNPIPVNPNLSVATRDLQPIYQVGVLAGNDATFSTPDTAFSVRHERNPAEQRSVSLAENVLAPPGRPRFHASHDHQHGAGGPATRDNLQPVVSSANVGTIHAWENQVGAIRQERGAEDSASGDRFVQVTTSRFDAGQVRPRLASDRTLQGLQEGDETSRAMKASIDEQARRIPAGQERRVHDQDRPAEGAFAEHHLNLDQIMGKGGSEDQPRYSASHLAKGSTRAAFERAGRPTGDPRQFATDANPVQRRTDALAAVHAVRGSSEEVRAAHRQAMEQVQRGDARLGYVALEEGEARQPLPSPLKRNRADEQTMADARSFLGEEPLGKRPKTPADPSKTGHWK